MLEFGLVAAFPAIHPSRSSDASVQTHGRQATSAEARCHTWTSRAVPRHRLRAFFDSAALAAWHGTSRSIAMPRLLGPYVLEWPPSDRRDEVLGRMGGIFRATVMHIEPNDHVFLADAFWLPPDGGPLGPLAVQITLTARRRRPTGTVDAGASRDDRLRQTVYAGGGTWVSPPRSGRRRSAC